VTSVDELAAAIRGGSVRALARGLTSVESAGPDAEALVEALYPYTRPSHVVGITGAPGAGKSTLVQGLAAEARRRGLTVGVLAVDPSSPYTGGAILGDRIRMGEVASDPHVFIRSMATRGALGGLSRQAADAVDVLCAAGRQLVIVETVGVGQDEVDIMRVAHTVVVVSVPGLGDDIQALKAGILEIADIHVVNKTDREGADRTVAELKGVLGMDKRLTGSWVPPIVSCVATRAEGIAELADEVTRHYDHLCACNDLGVRERRMAESRVLMLAQSFVAETFRPTQKGIHPLSADIECVAERRLSPFRCARMLLSRVSDSQKVASHVRS
jgi:LAO/AO transport system kinase